MSPDAAQILITERHDGSECAVTLWLKQGGYRNVVSCKCCSDILQDARRLSPDLVLIDYEYSCEPILSICERLRSEVHLEGVPILVATGSTSPQTRREIFSAGATDVIFKPVQREELLIRIGIHLEKRFLIKRLMDFQQRMADELNGARTMQESLLPPEADIRRIEAHFPVKITSHYKASSGLGGDMWGIYTIGPSKLLIFNADFSGHGVGAALNTFRLHSYLLGARKQSLDPAAWLDEANRFLCDVLPVGQFATMFCGVIDIEALTLCYSCASSPPHLLRTGEAGSVFSPIDGTGFPLGVCRDADYANITCAFPPGSDLFLFSDALIETPTPSAPVFTPASIAAFLDGLDRSAPVETLRDAVLGIINHESAPPLTDDLTLVILRHNGAAR